MHDGTVGRRYARALILAVEGGSQETMQKISDELSAVAALLDRRTGQQDFRQAMLNPSFAAEQRKKVLDGVGEAHQFETVTKSFLRLLVEKDRLPSLPSIADAFRAEVDEKSGRVRATILTAKELSPQALADIVRGLEKRTGKKVIPDVAIDPSVIAGVQAKIGGMVFDATVRSQLERLRQEFSVQ